MPVKPPRPYYVPVANEEQVFKAAFRQGLSIVLKGPTGCGKTRFVEAMAHDLDRPLITVSCHDDLTTADLVGRFLLRGGDTEWVDGPLHARSARRCDLLSRRGRRGAAGHHGRVASAGRSPASAADRTAGDHARRRAGLLPGRVVQPRLPKRAQGPQGFDAAADGRDRLRIPIADVEEKIVATEAAIDHDRAVELVRLGQAIRRLETGGLREVASTRVLIAAGRLIAEGLSPRGRRARRHRRTADRRLDGDPRPGRDDRRLPG